MKKGLIVGISFLFIVLMLSFISAGWFSNLFKAKITGQVVSDWGGCPDCIIERDGEWCDTYDSYCIESWNWEYCDGTLITSEDGCPCPSSCNDIPECSEYECGFCEYLPTHCSPALGDCGTCDATGEICNDDNICEISCTASETEIYRRVDISEPTFYPGDDTDIACCPVSTDCVANGECFSSDNYYYYMSDGELNEIVANRRNALSGDDSGEYCLDSVWYNEKSSISRTLCVDAFDWHYLTRNVDATSLPGYDLSTDKACCSTDTQCVANGYCRTNDKYHEPGPISGGSGDYCLGGKWYDEEPPCISGADCPVIKCQVASCASATCSYTNAKDGIACTSPINGVCSSGICVARVTPDLPQGDYVWVKKSGMTTTTGDAACAGISKVCSKLKFYITTWDDSTTECHETPSTIYDYAAECVAVSAPDCGDGVIDTGEGCDDGDTGSGDGCSNNCIVESGWACTGAPSVCTAIPQDCGNGQLDSGEECDDGNTVNTDDCTNVCKDNICGDGYLNAADEECDDGASNSDDDVDACRLDCKDPFCGDDVCDTGEPSTCVDDCGPAYNYIKTCVDCVGVKAGYTWCKNLGKCVAYPRLEGCTNMADYDYECKSECVNQMQEYLTEDLSTNLEVKSLLTALVSRCGLSFEFEILTSLPTGYVQIQDQRIIKILNITSDADEAETYVIDFILNESELDLRFSIENVTVYIEGDNEWLLPTAEDLIKKTQPKMYTYRFSTTHFSLFLITEPDYCGNEVFDTGYEVCDGSVAGVTNCTADCTGCDSGFDANLTGFCIESPEGTGCSPVGNESCTGYTFYECGSDLEWDKKGKVIGNCSVECYPIGNMSCQGEIPLRCGSDYQWDFQSKINGLCGYVSTTPLGYNATSNRCGNGYCNYDEDEFSCPEDCAEDDGEPKWGLIALVVGIAILILVIVIVLFKIFSKERRRMPPNRRLLPEHRPGPKRAPGRPLEHNLPVGRPAVGQGPYPRRRYPVR